jgi:hypothetical protein
MLVRVACNFDHFMMHQTALLFNLDQKLQVFFGREEYKGTPSIPDYRGITYFGKKTLN